MNELEVLNVLKELSSKDWLDYIGILAPTLLAGLAILFGYRQVKKTIEGDKHLEERKEIHKRLNEFYGPVLQYLQKSRKLYVLFYPSLEKLWEKKGMTGRARSIVYFKEFGKSEFDQADLELFEEILRIGKKIEDLIFLKSGLIKNTDLPEEILSDYTTHLYLLNLSYEGRLSEQESMEIEKHVFNLKLEAEIKKAKNQLEDRLKELNQSK